LPSYITQDFSEIGLNYEVPT